MGKALYKLFWGITTGLTLPTILILASWNALPGDIMFPVKLSLEKTLVLFMTPFGGAGFDIQLSYTERRFDEATRLLARSGSTEGFVYLDNQVESTKTQIIAEKGNTVEQEKRKQAYIETLNNLSLKLESEKVSITENQPAVNTSQSGITLPTKTPTPTRIPGISPVTSIVRNTSIPTQTIVKNSPSPIPTKIPESSNNPEEAVKKIEETQKKIEETIHELEQAKNADTINNVQGNTKEKEDKEEEKKKEEEKNNKSNDKKENAPKGNTTPTENKNLHD